MLRRNGLILIACVLMVVLVFGVSGCSSKPADEQKPAASAGETKTPPAEGEDMPDAALVAASGEGRDTGETEPVPDEGAEAVKNTLAEDTEWILAAAPAANKGTPGRPDPATVTKCAVAPVIDGKLDDACWRTAEAAGTWVDVYTGKVAAPQSRAFITYDDKNLYVAFYNPEPKMDALVTDVVARDGAVWNDDSNELFLDPTAGRKDYFQFIVNSAGALYDGEGRDAGFNSKCTVKVHKGEKGWSAEFAIPLADLDAKAPFAGQTWTANFCRNRQTTGVAEASAWSDTGESFHNAEAFGKLNFK